MSKPLLDLDALQRQLEGSLAGAKPGDAFTEAVVVVAMHLSKNTRAAIDELSHEHENQIRGLMQRVDRLEQANSAARKELAALRRATA